jgi:CubicO group peptidase (beta-lactamase class C family)
MSRCTQGATRLWRLLTVGLFAALLLSCASAPPALAPVARGDQRAVVQQLEAFIAHEMRRHQVTGLSVALVDDQQVLWAHGAGWADQAAQVRATPHTVYRMGSISKLFTATAALQLAEQGCLALDAPIQEALPGFQIRSRFGPAPITARQLMSHHAGLPRDVLSGMWGEPVAPWQAMVAGLRHADAAYPPGPVLSYSNVGFTVLGAAIEQVAAEPFEAHVQRHVLGPLGMGSASFATGVAEVPAMSRAYREGLLASEPHLRDVPAGGLNASVLDMSRFVMMVLAQGRSGDRVILQAPTVAEMLRVQNADQPLDVGFGVGLGWMRASFGDQPLRHAGLLAHHSGATVHFHSVLMVLPEHKLGVVVAANSSSARSTVQAVARRALALALEAQTGLRQVEPAPVFTPASSPWPEAELQAWVGEYTSLAGWLRVWREGEGLRAQVAGQVLELLPGEQGQLGLRYRLWGWLPLPVPALAQLTLQRRHVAGRDLLVGRMGGQDMLLGERLAPEPQAPGWEAWAGELVGVYEPVLAPGEHAVLKEVVVSRQGPRLLAQTVLTEPGGPAIGVPVRLLSANEGVLQGALAGGGEVVRLSRHGGVLRLWASGYEFKKR